MINRWAFYGLTVLSCALLAGIFISRGDTARSWHHGRCDDLRGPRDHLNAQ